MGRKTSIPLAAGAILALAAAVGNYLAYSSSPAAAPLGIERYRLAGVDGGEDAFDVEPIDTEFLDMLGAREVSFRTYPDGNRSRVWVFLGYFDRQKEGSQVHSPTHCYPGSGWNILEEGEVEAPWPGGRVKRLIVSNGADERLVYYWFQTSERIINNVFSLKYHLTRRAVLRQPQDVVFARVSASTSQGREEAEARVREFSLRVERVVSELYERRGGGSAPAAPSGPEK